MSSIRKITFAAAFISASVLALTGCTTGNNGKAATSAEPAKTALSGELNIFAAASLTNSFNEIAQSFSQENPDITVNPIVYDGSKTLATQIVTGGAPADVFASADEANMNKVTEAGLVKGEASLFARNTLVIVTPKDNTAAITGLSDLAKPEVKTVLCQDGVPCGTASGKLLKLAGVKVTPQSEEQNVRSVLAKVEQGEADAGLVYRTDAAGNDKVQTIEAEGADSVVNKYPIAQLDASPNSAAATAFIAYVTGPKGQEILASHGFVKP